MFGRGGVRDILCIGLLTALTAVADISSGTALHVGPTVRAPSVDGELSDQCWRDATMASGFITTFAQWVGRQTTALVTYDDTSLYLAFRCEEPTPEKLTARAVRRDSNQIFSDDNVEFFLDTNYDRETYYHFVVNPAGKSYEAYCHTSDKEAIREEDWDPDWQLTTRVGIDHWVAEIAIPFAALGTARPKPGSVWGLNLNRSQRLDARDGTYSSWAAIGQGFNRPDAFGKLIFGAPADISYSVISLGDPVAGGKLRMILRNGKDEPATVRTQWGVSPSWADTATEAATTHLAEHAQSEIVIPYEVPARSWDDIPLGPMGAVDFKLEVADAVSGNSVDIKKGSFEWGWGPVMDLSMDRYYYTPDDRKMRIDLSLHTDVAVRAELVISRERLQNWPMDDELGVWPANLRRQDVALVPGKQDYSLPIDIADLDSGRYIVSVHLVDDAGSRVHSIHRVFIKRRIDPAEMPPHTVTVDIRSDGILLRDGKPFCPFFGMSSQTSPLATDCFNTRYGNSKAGLVSKPLDRPKVGLPWVTTEDDKVFVVLPDEERMLRGIRGKVLARKSDPSLLCWLIKTEAIIPMVREVEGKRVPLNNVEEYRKVREFVKSIAPTHLTSIYVSHSHYVSRFKDSADIIEVGYPSSSFENRLLPHLTRDLKEIRKVLGPGKPFFFWIGSSIPSPEKRTAEEIRCASYLALMYGAAGIVFHMGHRGVDPTFTRHWSVYSGLSREVAEVFAMLTSPQQEPEPKITVVPDSIDYRVRQYNDRLYLIAVNTADHLVEATVSIGDVRVIPKRIGLRFENRDIDPQGNRFNDTFTAYEPHVYEFEP